MKRRFLAAIACGAAACAGTAGAQPAPNSSVPVDLRVDDVREGLDAIDLDRIYDDRDYAREVLRQLDDLDAATAEVPLELEIDSVRLAALGTLGEDEQVRIVIDRVLEQRANVAAPYTFAWWAALTVPDVDRAVAILDQASRRVPGVGWRELREAVGTQTPPLILSYLERENRDVLRERFAASLFRIGWPGNDDLERTDGLRQILVDYRMKEGDHRAAAELAAGISDPYVVLPLILVRRYDPLFADDSERLERLRAAIAQYDRLTQAALGTEPSVGAAFQRARFLRRLGREREALALLEPFTRDVAALAASDYRGIWVANEAAYAMLSLGRADEAVALMERLIEIPIETNGDLIGPFINHSIVLLEAGRAEQALAHALRLERDFSRFANDYGKRVIDSSIVCALAALGRPDEAQAALGRLSDSAESVPAPLTRASLCVGDLATAEATVIERLEGEHPASILIDLQDYALASEGTVSASNASLISLRDRPAVRAAIERVGRVLELPLARLDLGGI